jgi:hypothetical protein
MRAEKPDQPKRRKSVITHKDADQNMCRLAAFCLDIAGKVMRDKTPDTLGYYSRRDGSSIENGYNSSKYQSWWSYNSLIMFGNKSGDVASMLSSRNDASAICWYSFQNLIRIRLREARKEIKAARYMRKNKVKTSIQASRNPVKRSVKSKWGRQHVGH